MSKVVSKVSLQLKDGLTEDKKVVVVRSLATQKDSNTVFFETTRASITRDNSKNPFY
jgi:hypothetical protein